ncbi:MAG: hypothetical protein IPJ40_20255 [Saprospirales bacterium]|nr:hypothetical protein [Saprospirales bacterium]
MVTKRAPKRHFLAWEWSASSPGIDLTTNDWDLLINDVSQGSFINATNLWHSGGYIPLYASGTSQFYVDDVSFEYLPPVLPIWDAAMNAVSVRPLSPRRQ